MKITFFPDGTARTIDTIPFPIGKESRIRVSKILPVNPAKRMAFILLRRVFGEDGIMAAWTRKWHGPWEATILETKETFNHPQRQECLEWERNKIQL